MSKENPQVEITYTSEFPKGWEVEWKGNLTRIDPADLVYHLYERIADGEFGSYRVPPAVGTYPLTIRYFDVLFHFYGHRDDDKWINDFTLAQFPNSEVFFPKVKKDAPGIEPLEALGTNATVRWEVIKEDIRNRFSPQATKKFISEYEEENSVSVQKVGTIRRERYSFYATNVVSNRNWGILADRSQLVTVSGTPTLHQVEVEYRTILGKSSQDLSSQTAVLTELDELGEMIVREVGRDKLAPTKLTKFHWIVANSNI